MPNIDLSILNQRQTPAFYADVFANRPAAGFVGRIFVSTDTYAFYRDNGTGWDLIGGPGTGTVTGSGAAGQVAFWSGSSLISGENNLWWDSTNNHFGINTNTPGTALDVHHDQSTLVQLNQTTAANDTRIAFQNSGVSLWRIGNFYNAGANDWGIYDVVGAAQPLTIKKTTGQVLIGTSTVGSGKLVVASATGDNGIQIVGATAPSLRIDSAESGPTKRVGLGISTATNNFIQGSADRDFCIFNGSTAAASPILFGIYDAAAVNVQEAARISPARNFIVGSTTDNGQKLQVNGTSRFSGFAFINHSTASSYGAAIYNTNANGEGLAIRGGSTSSHSALVVQNYDGSSALFNVLATGAATFSNTLQATSIIRTISSGGTINTELQSDGVYTNNTDLYLYAPSGKFLSLWSNGSSQARLTSSGNLLIGTTTDAGQKLQVNGTALINGNLGLGSYILTGGGAAQWITTDGNPYGGGLISSVNGVAKVYYYYDSSGYGVVQGVAGVGVRLLSNNVTAVTIKTTGVVNIASMPTSSAGLVSGDLWNNAGVVNIIP